jgi:UDP-N-acetylglucosamine--N-acetylmuramyl-(pentapeptide) pyrophosphoryl-undecaprenol N-acetylglucosamine transferase
MTGLVLICGGGDRRAVGSGLAVADELIAQDVAVHWLGGHFEADRSLIAQHGIELSAIGPRPTTDETEPAWRAAASLPAATAAALAALLKLRPSVVFAIGGLPSTAGAIAAGMLGLPIVLHEANATPSPANQTLAPWADLICCGFEAAITTFASLPTEWTGNPVDARFFASPPLAPHAPPNLVVLGRGSLLINRTLPTAVSHLVERGVPVAVRHHASSRWAEVVRSAYRDHRIDAEIEVSLATPWQALQDADLIVARADAVTISEIAAAGRGALLIPLKAPHSPQPHNAAAIARAGGAVVIEEDRTFADVVADKLAELLRAPERLATMGHRSHRMARPHAARRIAKRLYQAGGQA